MARPVAASEESLTIHMGRLKIEILAPSTDAPKITITVQNENPEYQERRDTVPVQETESTAQPTQTAGPASSEEKYWICFVT